MPVFLPGEFHGLCSPWGHKESDMTEQLLLSTYFLQLSGCYNFQNPWIPSLVKEASLMEPPGSVQNQSTRKQELGVYLGSVSLSPPPLSSFLSLLLPSHPFIAFYSLDISFIILSLHKNILVYMVCTVWLMITLWFMYYKDQPQNPNSKFPQRKNQTSLIWTKCLLCSGNFAHGGQTPHPHVNT